MSTAASGGGGCDHCYAEISTPVRIMRSKGEETWGPGAPRHRTSAANWKRPIRWNAQPFVECSACGWRGELREATFGGTRCPTCSPTGGTLWPARRRVFCASLADVFDNEVDPAWRADLFALIAATPNLSWLLLTKRIGNAHQMIGEALITLGTRPGGAGPTSLLPSWPWPNVWLMATMVNQAEYDRDIGKLLRTPAVVHGISVEPMLGAMNLRLGGASLPDYARHHPLAPLDWVIVGGESGTKARPMHPDWARSLRKQCAAAGTPFLFKQWGEWAPYPQEMTTEERRAPSQRFNLDERWEIWRCGKKAAGRLLDGIEHNGFPEVRHA